MLSRLFDRWSKSRSLTSQELAVLRLLLPVGNEYSKRLLSQAANAPYIERKRTGMDGYEAIIPYVIDDTSLIECDESIDSPPITFTTSTGTTMTFTTTIQRGGFLRGLKGQTTDGTYWPKKWAVELGSARIPSSISTWIPQPIEDKVKDKSIDQLFRWCGILEQEPDSLPDRKLIRIAEPATDPLIEACEARLQLRLSPQYRQFVSIANGFGIKRGRPYEFLGTTDLEYVNGAREWLCLTPLYEEGCVAIRCSNGIASDECFLLTGDGSHHHVGDIKRHVRESLRWEDAAM